VIGPIGPAHCYDTRAPDAFGDVLFDGFWDWTSGLPGRGKDTLVVGGCTLNSCVRVPSVEVQQSFRGQLQVILDLSLCGAQATNYVGSSLHAGVSPVVAALGEIIASGVRAAAAVRWT